MATGAKITGLVTRWWWVRHAPVPNPEARCYGQSDKDCDVSNRALFEHQAKLLPRGAVWYASNLLRARKTAEHLGQAGADMGTLAIEPDLAEQHFGDWQGRTYDEVRDGSQGHWHRFWLSPAAVAPPGGESFVDLMARVVPAVHRLNDLYRGRDIVAVTHGGTIRAALAEALRLEPEAALRLVVDNCSLTRIDHVPGPTGSHAPDETHAWRVEFANLSPRRLVGAGVAGAPA